MPVDGRHDLTRPEAGFDAAVALQVIDAPVYGLECPVFSGAGAFFVVTP